MYISKKLHQSIINLNEINKKTLHFFIITKLKYLFRKGTEHQEQIKGRSKNCLIINDSTEFLLTTLDIYLQLDFHNVTSM